MWYKTVVRGDKYPVTVGNNTNIQDRTVIQCVNDDNVEFEAKVTIGDHCTIGHGALLTSCSVGDFALIGQGAVVTEGCTVGSHAIIAAGAVLPPNTHVPDKQLWAGNPAKFVRDVSAEEIAHATKVMLSSCPPRMFHELFFP